MHPLKNSLGSGQKILSNFPPGAQGLALSLPLLSGVTPPVKQRQGFLDRKPDTALSLLENSSKSEAFLIVEMFSTNGNNSPERCSEPAADYTRNEQSTRNTTP